MSTALATPDTHSISQDEAFRFWTNVTIVAEECWEWQAAKTDGYGVGWAEGRVQRAHRIVVNTAGRRVCKVCRSLYKRQWRKNKAESEGREFAPRKPRASWEI